ncbi:hypothetical protein M501DRAFT_993685, partial [Patellaria atrata CBS 101060]
MFPRREHPYEVPPPPMPQRQLVEHNSPISATSTATASSHTMLPHPGHSQHLQHPQHPQGQAASGPLTPLTGAKDGKQFTYVSV